MMQPILTVVMPVYNGEKYLNEAIDSVLNQTFTDFELLIINDASVDNSLDVISSYTDKRIRLLNNPENKGIPHNRNLGIRKARGEFLCWTDCDDVILPTRFEKQITFLRENTDYGGCGTWIVRFKGDKTYYTSKVETHSEIIKALLLFRPAAIPNPTAMLRLSKVRKHDLWYNEAFPISEDYDFIFRCSRHFKLTNLPEVLYRYRDSETSIMKKFETEVKKSSEIHQKIYRRALTELDINPSAKDLLIHESICSRRMFDSFSEFKDAYSWLKKLESANDKVNIYEAKVLKKVMGEQFYFVAKKSSRFGIKTLVMYISKSLKEHWNVKFKDFMKLTVRCVLKYNKFEFDKF